MHYQELISKFQNIKNLNDANVVYKNFYSECLEHNLEIIISSKNNTQTFPLFKTINNIPQIKTLFEYSNFSVLNPKLFQKMQSDKIQVGYDYSISFDLNSARYLHDLLNNKTSKIPNGFSELISFFITDDIQLDYVLYLVENITKNIDKDKFFENTMSLQTLMSVDKDYFLKTNQIRSIHSKSELIKIVENSIETESTHYQKYANELKRIHLLMKVILYSILIARFKYKNNQKLQLEYILDFMKNNLFAIFHRELIVGMKYFSEKQNFEFFKKVNTQSFEKLIKYIDNMAWDFVIVRILELLIKDKPKLQADVFIPFLFTYDKGLLDIMSLTSCKAFLFSKKYNYHVPLYNKSIASKLKKHKLDEYFTLEAIKSREEQDINNINLEVILEQLQNDLKKIMKL